MADKQIIASIKINTKEIVAADKAIDRLTDSIEDLDKAIKDARKNNKQYKEVLKELDKQLDEGTLSKESHTKQTKLLNDQIDKNNRKIAETSQELSKQKRERTANIKLVNSERDALGQLEAKASLLNQAMTKQTKATKEGRAEFAKLQKELNEVNTEIREQRELAEDYTKTIGRYKTVLEGLEEVQPQVVGGIQGIGSAFKALLANPIVLFLAAIVGAMKVFFDAFKKSASGSRILGKAMAALKGVFAIVTRAANQLGELLETIWDDPKKAAEDFGKTLEDNLSKRMDGIKELFSGIGDQIVAAWEGDNKKLAAAMKATDEAVLKAGTGMEKTEREMMALQKALDDKRAENLAAAFVALEEAQRAGRGTVRSLEKQIAKLNEEFEMLAEVAGDDTRNMHEMEQAAIDAGVAAEKLANKQMSLAQARLNLINQEVAVRRSAGEDIQDLLDEQADAEVALTEARSQSAIAQQKILIEQRKIERDIFEQNLDIFLDIGASYREERESLISDESLSLEKRRKLLEENAALTKINFQDIIKEYELYGVTAEQVNEVINASDAKQTNERLKALKLNEIANNRLREIIIDKRKTDLDYADLQKDLDKEEIERKEKAVNKIGQLEQKQVLNSIDNAEDLRDKLIEIELLKRSMLLENETLLAEEREAIILQSEVKIQEIKDNFADENKEKEKENFEKRAELLNTFFGELIQASGEFAGEEFAIFSRIGASISKAFEDGKISAMSALEGLQMASDAVFANIDAKNEERLAKSEEQRQVQLELAGSDEEAKLKINEKFDKKQSALKLKQFKADKAKALIDIGIQTAVASVKTAGTLGFPAAIPFIALVAALGITQAAIVATKKPPKFAQGTGDIVNIGGSHASGNDVDVYGYSGSETQYFGKVEKGEAMPVIRKSAVNDYLISKLNGQFTPKQNRVFQEGTPDITKEGTTETQSRNNQEIAAIVTNAIQNVKIVAKIEDITAEAEKKIEIEDNSQV
jgi:hypothetical protein